MADSLTEMKEILKFEGNASEARLLELGVLSWPIYCQEPSEKFPVCIKAREIMYLQEGKVTISCQGLDGSLELVVGNMVEFPKGINITWHVTETVKKYYHIMEEEKE